MELSSMIIHRKGRPEMILADFALIEFCYFQLRNSRYILCSLNSAASIIIKIAELCYAENGVRLANPVTEFQNVYN